jgi:hypothetical protein
MKKKIIFEVEFETEDMCDKETLKKEYRSDWNRLMRYLYKSEGLGLFSKPLKFIKVK